MDLVVQMKRLPRLGETLGGGNFNTYPGGKGANQAIAAARLGASVTMAGCVGNDLYGKQLLSILNQNKVDTGYIRILDNEITGIALITVVNGDNAIMLSEGANLKLKPADVEKCLIENPEIDIVVMQMEISEDTVEQTVKMCNSRKIPILLNPAPARKIPSNILGNIDIFTPNEIESEFFTGISIRSMNDAKKAVKALLGKGIRQVVITLGSKGIVYNSGDRILHKPVPAVAVLDTTGAGDAFTAALAVSLASGKDIDEATNQANAAGSLAVMRHGAQESLPTKDQVARFCAETYD
jgi:ribokinase